MHNMWHGWGWGVMLVLGVIIVVGVFAAVLLAARSGSGAPADQKTALDVLKERYARGEIDDEEFERRKRRLEQ